MMACFVILTRSMDVPAGCRGDWTTRGVKDWNHATELLKQHIHSQWHRDVAVSAVLELQCSSAAWEAAER